MNELSVLVGGARIPWLAMGHSSSVIVVLTILALAITIMVYIKKIYDITLTTPTQIVPTQIVPIKQIPTVTTVTPLVTTATSILEEPPIEPPTLAPAPVSTPAPISIKQKPTVTPLVISAPLVTTATSIPSAPLVTTATSIPSAPYQPSSVIIPRPETGIQGSCADGYIDITNGGYTIQDCGKDCKGPIDPDLKINKNQNKTDGLCNCACVLASQAPKQKKWICMSTPDNQYIPIQHNLNINDPNYDQIQCLSTDATKCTWTPNSNTCAKKVIEIQKTPIKPLACGPMHKTIYGIDGYSDPTHWCAIAKNMYKQSPNYDLFLDSSN
jgi:hypothetical protein